MKFSFTDMMGTISLGTRTLKQVSTVGVLIQKEDRDGINTSEQLKLSKNYREVGSEKFSFFKWNIGSVF